MSSVFLFKWIDGYEHTYHAINIVKMNVKDGKNMSVSYFFIYHIYHLNIYKDK